MEDDPHLTHPCIYTVVPPVSPMQPTVSPPQPTVSPSQPVVPQVQPGPMPDLNWSHLKPEFTGKPDENAEAHVLRTND